MVDSPRAARSVNDEHQQAYATRLRRVKPVIDVQPPRMRIANPLKRILMNKEEAKRIEENNFRLANRIFNIFGKEARIKQELQPSMYLESHPGTMNFNTRLNEAKRINQSNARLARRLEAIQSYYNGKLLPPPFRRPAKKNRDSPRHKVDTEKHGNDAALEVLSQPKDSNILLFEYSKIQNGRVLDVAVTKDGPDLDTYTIFGVDVDNGQKYELHISAGILEEDILVTAVNDPNVWMALLNQRELIPVEHFSPSRTRKPKVEFKIPHAPESLRPSGARAFRRDAIREAERVISITDAKIAARVEEEELTRVIIDEICTRICFKNNTIHRLRKRQMFFKAR